MLGKLPEIWLECRDGRNRPGCGERTPTRAAGGASIACRGCGKHMRVPADRPRTEAQAQAHAAGARGELADAWAAETPYDPRSAPAGQHAGELSAEARQRAEEHQAAARGTRRPRADRDAERVAAETLAADRAELGDVLGALAEYLDVSDFPRDDSEPGRVRRVAIRHAGTTADYMHRASKAASLTEFRAVEADALAFARGISPWLTRIAQLRDELDDGQAVEFELDDLDELELDDDPPAPARRPPLTARERLAARHYTNRFLGRPDPWMPGTAPPATTDHDPPPAPHLGGPAAAHHDAVVEATTSASLRVQDLTRYRQREGLPPLTYTQIQQIIGSAR